MTREVAGEAEILTIVIAREHRRQGHGEELLKATFGRFEKTATDAIFLEVACGNQAAIGLYRRFGFYEIGRRKGYTIGLDGELQDALRMVCDLKQGQKDAVHPHFAEQELT